jgi:LytS/YehU family sensor histidine kinase
MINTGNNDLAGQFLLRFSKLLRIVIEQSPIAKINLAEELRLLSIYVDLEKTRFNNKFEFDLIIEDNVDPDMLLIPSFILQPFAENAIIHGLMNKREDDRKLEIIIKLFHEELHCIIRDNGIGRKQANIEREKRGDTNKSVAISNTKQRLEMINIDIKNPVVSVEIKDLKDDNFKDAGTEVYLRIKKELVDLEKLEEDQNT